MISLELHYAILAVGTTLGLLLLVALVTRGEKSLSNRLLGAFIFCIFYYLGIGSLHNTELIQHVPFLIRSHFAFGLSACALLYFYVRSMTQSHFEFRVHHARHLVVPLIGLVWYATLFFYGDPDWNTGESLYRERHARITLLVVMLGTYVVLSFRCLSEYANRSARGEPFSSETYHWLRALLWGNVVLWLFCAADVVIGPSTAFARFLPLMITLALLGIAYRGLLSAAIFAPGNGLQLVHEAGPLGATRGSSFSADELQRYRARLLDCMEKQKMFLEPQLRLSDLAQVLGLKVYETSDVINRSLGMSFYDLVNSRRVEEAKARLVDARYLHKTVLEIATECGFNSKSSFNEIFKRATGLTPTAFREENRNS